MRRLRRPTASITVSAATRLRLISRPHQFRLALCENSFPLGLRSFDVTQGFGIGYFDGLGSRKEPLATAAVQLRLIWS
jgi:hypothetical protein